jgi:hypothetical protein
MTEIESEDMSVISTGIEIVMAGLAIMKFKQTEV